MESDKNNPYLKYVRPEFKKEFIKTTTSAPSSALINWIKQKRSTTTSSSPKHKSVKKTVASSDSLTRDEKQKIKRSVGLTELVSYLQKKRASSSLLSDKKISSKSTPAPTSAVPDTIPNTTTEPPVDTGSIEPSSSESSPSPIISSDAHMKNAKGSELSTKAQKEDEKTLDAMLSTPEQFSKIFDAVQEDTEISLTDMTVENNPLNIAATIEEDENLINIEEWIENHAPMLSSLALEEEKEITMSSSTPHAPKSVVPAEVSGNGEVNIDLVFKELDELIPGDLEESSDESSSMSEAQENNNSEDANHGKTENKVLEQPMGESPINDNDNANLEGETTESSLTDEADSKKKKKKPTITKKEVEEFFSV